MEIETEKEKVNKDQGFKTVDGKSKKKPANVRPHDILGPLSLWVLCFQGFGLRIFDGIIPGAIALWAIILFAINYKYIFNIKSKYWVFFFLLIIVYVIFNKMKGVSPAPFLIIAWFSGVFAMSRYIRKRKRFVLDMSKLCYYSMIYSLLHIPIMLLFNSFLYKTSYNMSPETFLGLFWFNRDEGVFGLPRIQGFAWEPSCWNLLLNLNLVFVLYFKRPLRDVVLSILAIVSIMSTTGLMTMMAIIGLNWLMNLKLKQLSRSFLIGVIPLLLLAPFVIKQFLEKMDSTSGNTRLGDIYVAIAVVTQNPLFGGDLDNITDNFEAMLARRMAWTQDNGINLGYMENEMVNSFAALFVEWGLPLAILVLVGFIANRLVLDWKLNCLIVVTVFLVIFGTPITRTGFFYMFVLSTFMLPRFKSLKEKSRLTKKKRRVLVVNPATVRK